jgi:hypothetical protein
MEQILCSYRIAEKLPKGEYLLKGKGLHVALLILIRTLHGCSLIVNAGAYSPDITIIYNQCLPLSLLTLAEWKILIGIGVYPLPFKVLDFSGN